MTTKKRRMEDRRANYRTVGGGRTQSHRRLRSRIWTQSYDRPARRGTDGIRKLILGAAQRGISEGKRRESTVPSQVGEGLKEPLDLPGVCLWEEEKYHHAAENAKKKKIKRALETRRNRKRISPGDRGERRSMVNQVGGESGRWGKREYPAEESAGEIVDAGEPRLELVRELIQKNSLSWQNALCDKKCSGY